MISQTISSLDQLNDFLKNNSLLANGKNFKVDHLHSTGAKSRFEYENLFGIYLTNTEYAWMALWMGITNRERIKKRNITYIKPDKSKDYIGNVAIYYDRLSKDDVFCKNGAYLYLFDENNLMAPKIDLRHLPKKDKLDFLRICGFYLKEIKRGEQKQMNYFPDNENKTILLMDCWQLALVNYNKIIPDVEIFIEPKVVDKLKNNTLISQNETLDDYIKEK